MKLKPLLTLLSVLALAGPCKAAALGAEVRDQDGNPLADAVISLTPALPVPAGRVLHAIMDQRGLQFVPRVLVVQRGTTVTFPNSDQVRHHVYSFSPAKKFELRLYKSMPAEPVLFDQAGIATLGCNIHDWMLGHVVVTDTPWFAKTDATGRLRIDAIPPGEYALRLWHARALDADVDKPAPVRIEGQDLQREFRLAVRPEPPPAAPSELEQKFRAYQKKLPDDA